MWGEKKTKIVATLSDFRANEEFVRGLFEAGIDSGHSGYQRT